MALLIALTGCGDGSKRQPAIGEAFVGPVSLNLRTELTPRASVTATVKHGERLEIIERRRRFAKVRTSQGAEGWTDGRQLLTPQQMARLRKSAEVALKLPSQGRGMAYDVLNVHMAPNRQAPSFHQLKENDQVDVIGRRVAPRVPYQPDRKVEPAADASLDTWSHVRLADGRAGWVLSRMIMMAIPDEVAQYAEGHHITAYFSLGSVQDAARGQTKHHWLWTTIADNRQPHHFDSFRVFVYSLRRHRYETAYIERNLRGYHPVEIEPAGEGEMARFSLAFAGRDGVLARRSYEFQGYRVRMISKSAWSLPVDELDQPFAPAPEEAKATPASVSLTDRLRLKWREWFPN
jgi:SH3-like domain-containing protein